MNTPIPLYNQTNNIGDQLNNDEICAICLENINIAPIHTINECNHSFHSNCLIESLRINNQCPLCRSISTSSNKNYHRRPDSVILRHILSFSKSKNNKCKKLKSIVKTYEKYRDNFKKSNTEYIEIMKNNKDILKKIRNLRSKKWKNYRKLRNIRSDLLCIPILPINKN